MIFQIIKDLIQIFQGVIEINKMCERVGLFVQIILSNNFSYTGKILEEDNFFIILKDQFGKQISIGKKDIQVIKEMGK